MAGMFDDLVPDQPDAPADNSGGGLSFDDLVPTQQAAPEQAAPEQPQAPAAEGELATGVRVGAHAVVPGAAALAAAGYGATVGAAAGPVGSIIGGLAGLIVGGYAGNKVQQAGLDAIGYDDSIQMAADINENPKSAMVGEIAGSMLAMNPAAAGVKLAERGVAAGGMAAFDAGQQYFQKGSIDPTEVAASGAAGFVAPRLNKAGEAVMGAGARLAGKVPGRPAAQPNPEAAPAQDEAASSQQATVTGDTSLQQPAPSADGSTTGNPQSAPARSDRAYPKEPTTSAPQPDMLTEGNFAPDIADALQSSLDSSAVIDRTPAPPIPDPTNGVDASSMTYKGEQLPIKTGLEGVPQTKAPVEQPAEAQTAAPQDTQVPVETGITEAAQPAPAEEPAPVVNQFQTSKGSTYDLHPDNTTTRNKAARPEHPGDEGPKTRSAKTYFMEPQALNALAPPQDARFRVIDHGDGTLSLATQNKDKRWGIPPSAKAVPITSMEPKEGLHPLEVWSPATTRGITSYGAMHPGNEIVKVGGDRAPGPVDVPGVQREPAEEAAPAVNKPVSFNDLIPGHPENLNAKMDAAAKDVHPTPSPEQAEAGNYAKGHPGKVYGRKFSIETAKGETRRDMKHTPPEWEVPNYPTHYGELLGTKGADGDRIDYHHVGTGDRHFVIDQRNPEGGFDEHKIMGYAKDAADAMDHYNRGFNDNVDRVGSIKEASEQELTDWLNTPGAKKKPYDPNFKDNGGPAEGVKPPPVIVTAAVNELRAKGEHGLADALEALPLAERMARANQYVNKSDKPLKRVDRIRTAAPKVEGLGVDARSHPDAMGKKSNLDKMNAAYEKLGDIELPKTPEEKAALRTRLEQFNEDAKGADYKAKGSNSVWKPAVKTEPYALHAAIKKLLTAKNPTDKSWMDFAAKAAHIKEDIAGARADTRTEADISMSKRSGDDAVANAESKNAGADQRELEDAALANVSQERAANTVKELDSYFAGDIDREALSEKTQATLKAMPADVRKAGFDADENPANAAKVKDWLANHFGEFDVPHEEAESMVKPEPVTTAADVKKFDTKTGKLDLSKPADRAKLSTESRQLTENLIKTADHADAPSEDKRVAGKKIDVGGVNHAALLASLEKASKKTTSDPHRIGLDEIGKHATDFWSDTKGAVSVQKIRADWNVHIGPRVRGLLHKLFGLRDEAHFTPDAIMRQGVTSREKRLSEIADAVEGHMGFYDTLNDRQQMHVQESIENQKGSTFNKQQLITDLQAGPDGLTREQAQIAADHRDVHAPLYDWLWQQDKLHGSEEGYVENYVPHIFEEDKVNGQTATQWINALNKRMGATWYQKNRLFDTIKQARAAGFKPKYTNPIDLLSARMNASLTGHMMVDIAKSLQTHGLAELKTNATDFQKRFYTMERTLPDNNTWMFHPDIETLWKNAVEDKGLQGADNVAGGVYRNWMKWKRTAVPVQLAVSLFHEAHILSIEATNEMHRAAMNVARGDSFKSAYGAAFKNMKQDLLDMPLGRFYRAAEHPGKTLQKNWGKDSSQLSQDGDIWNKLLTEAGAPPKQAAEDIIGAKREFAQALRNYKFSGSKLLPGMKLALPALRRGVEVSQEWMFKHQIPQLKAAALKRSIADELRHDPGLVDDAVRRKVVLQRLAKNVDDRFGEKFYKGWFINKGLKDAMLGSFVSTGWQAGQLRQLGGAAVDATKMAGRWIDGADRRSPLAKAADDGFDKISFVGHYVGGTMLAAGALSWALSGKVPTGLDYLYPRTGYDNDDGTPNRVSTPFNTREGVQLKAHMDAHNSVMGGLGEYIWNKTILQPIADLMTNKNFYGEHMWDPDSNPVKQVLQAGDATLGTMFNPIALSGATRAYQTQGARGVALSVAGFGPAPKYVEQDPMQRRIAKLRSEDSAPEYKPYQYGPKTGLGHGGLQDLARAAAGDKTEAEARVEGRQKLLKAEKAQDQDGVSTAVQELIKEGHVAPSTIKSMMKGKEDAAAFARLPATDQIRLASTMDEEQFQRYVSMNQSNGITKTAKAVMIQQWRQRNLNR